MRGSSTSNPKWKPLPEGANCNATGRRHKKIVSKSNWFKRSGSSQEEEPASKRVRPQNPNQNDGFSGHQNGEVYLSSIREEEEVPLPSIRLDHSSIHQEHRPEDELRLDMGQGIEFNTNFSNKSYIQKSHRATKKQFQNK